MSVFGGDSWGGEAKQRKRRLDDLAIEGLDASSYKKLSNGKFACLVCPNNPVLDSPLMLSMHAKGARHSAAEAKRKEMELIQRDEISKRLALSDTVSSKKGGFHVPSSVKPLIEQAKKATSDVLSGRASSSSNTKSSNNIFHGAKCAAICPFGVAQLPPAPRERECVSFAATDIVQKENATILQHHVDYRERQERELRFTSAGWKRDGNGKWFKDENVEFDSDEEEEDPNVCLV